MPEPIRVTDEVVVPASALSLRTARSSGPGGQNVNKVASKVELRVDLAGIEGLPAEARQRLLSLGAGRMDAEGRLRIVSQRTRDQHRNLADARERVRELVARSLIAPQERHSTRPGGAARERRLLEKKRTAGRKTARRRVPETED